jgi:hypothetical protein
MSDATGNAVVLSGNRIIFMAGEFLVANEAAYTRIGHIMNYLLAGLLPSEK